MDAQIMQPSVQRLTRPVLREQLLQLCDCRVSDAGEYTGQPRLRMDVVEIALMISLAIRAT